MRASLTTGETCHSCETLRQTRWQEAQLKSNLCLQEITQKKLFENQEVVNFIGRGSVYEMDGQTKCHRNGKRRCLWNGNRNLLYPFLWHLVWLSISYWPKLFKKKFRIEIWTFSFQICFRNKFSTLGSGQTENYANTRICVFSVWPLPKVQNLFRKQIWNESVYILFKIFFWRVSVNVK